MARYIAIIDAAGLTADDFAAVFPRMLDWRFDKKAWIVKASASLESETVVVECECLDLAQFTGWLDQKGWRPRELFEIDQILEAGTIWPLKRKLAS
jgi:hypothetical protein